MCVCLHSLSFQSEPTLLSAEACDVLFMLTSAYKEFNQAIADAVPIALARLQSWYHTRSPLFTHGVSALAQIMPALHNFPELTPLLSMTKPPKEKNAKLAVTTFASKQMGALTHVDVVILVLSIGRLALKALYGLFIDQQITLTILTRITTIQPSSPLAIEVARTIVLMPGTLTQSNIAPYLSLFINNKADDLALEVSITFPKQASECIHLLIESGNAESSRAAAEFYGSLLKANHDQLTVS